MTIDNELKKNLIADVENVCGLELTEEQRASLERCFEITIGTRSKSLGLHVVMAGADVDEIAHALSMHGHIGKAVILVGDKPKLPEIAPPLIPVVQYCDYKDGRESRRERRKAERLGSKRK